MIWHVRHKSRCRQGGQQAGPVQVRRPRQLIEKNLIEKADRKHLVKKSDRKIWDHNFLQFSPIFGGKLAFFSKTNVMNIFFA
jgi:hypothetical protein